MKNGIIFAKVFEHTDGKCEKFLIQSCSFKRVL